MAYYECFERGREYVLITRYPKQKEKRTQVFSVEQIPQLRAAINRWVKAFNKSQKGTK